MVTDTDGVTAGHWRLESRPCPVCARWDARFRGFRGGWAHRHGRGTALAVVECTTCHLLYTQPTAVPHDLSHYRDPDTYLHPASTTMVQTRRELLRAAQDRLGRRGRLLDIGCGRGEALVAAAQAGWEAIGVEPSAEFAAAGRALGVEIVNGTVADLTEPEHSFDLVMLSGVLEHVYDPLEMLRAARSYLQAGGLTFIDVPNERSLVQRLSERLARARGRDWTTALSPTFAPYHVVGFSPRSLRFALDLTPLTPLSIDTYPLSFTSLEDSPGFRLIAGAEAVASRLRGGSGIVAWARRDG